MDQKAINFIRRRWIVLIVVAVLVIIAVANGPRLLGGQYSEGTTKAADSLPVEPALNARAPDFTLSTVSGETVHRRAVAGGIHRSHRVHFGVRAWD